MYQHRNIFNLLLTIISTEDQILLDKYLFYNSCNVLSVTNINITSIISIETLLQENIIIERENVKVLRVLPSGRRVPRIQG
jgi:hypothetical protein